ncbi:hypothetical protein ACFL1X_09355, partial [Candidatus Hydrogenedentota bacterium]
MQSIRIGSLIIALAVAFAFPGGSVQAAQRALRFDCGASDSLVETGYTRLTDAEKYTRNRGHGWETGSVSALVFDSPLSKGKEVSLGTVQEMLWDDANMNALNSDAVASRDDLRFRVDVPDGLYHVHVTIGDLSQAIGSIDVFVNDALAAEHEAAWRPGSYRGLDRNPAGWWKTVRASVEVKNGFVRIVLKKNQTYYDEQMAEQATWETPYAKWYHKKPIRQDPPYFYIGYPFVHSSVMSIEVVPYRPAPVTYDNEKLK